MRLADLTSNFATPTVVLLQTSSIKLQMFIEDTVKRRYKITQDSIIPIETKKDYKSIRDVLGVSPPFSDRWFVELDLTKHYNKDIINIIKESTTCVFFCTVDKYKTFKSVKDDLKSVQGVYDFYINYIRRPDMVYLYDALTLSDNKLSKQLFDYVVQSYSGDVESVMNLFLALNEGKKVESRSDIVDICGIGGLSTESYIFSLLKPLSGSARGLKTVMQNKIKAGTELGNSLGYKSFYNFTKKNIQSFCEIKMLLISGTIYKHIMNLPESYDEKTLSRYQRYLWRLKEVPLSRLLRLQQCIGNTQWTSEVDFLRFVYTYFEVETQEVLKNGNNS